MVVSWLFELETHYPKAYGNLSGILLRLAKHEETIRAYQQALRQDPSLAALAEGGRFGEAIAIAEGAFQLAAQSGNKALADSLRDQVMLYRSQQPVREGPQPPR